MVRKLAYKYAQKLVQQLVAFCSVALALLFLVPITIVSGVLGSLFIV